MSAVLSNNGTIKSGEGTSKSSLGTRGIREPLSKKYVPTAAYKKGVKGSKTPRGESSTQTGNRVTKKVINRPGSKLQAPKSGRAQPAEPEPAEVVMKKLTYQYSMTTARVENFKLTGLAAGK